MADPSEQAAEATRGSPGATNPGRPASLPPATPEPPVPLSALQHYSFCPRQCGLIYLDQVWADNLLTVRGTLAHRRTHDVGTETRDGVRIERGMALWCERLGLTGKSDVVEFHPDGSIYPVEYKHGRRHKRIHDDLQLCGQALCLEEMFAVAIPRGAVYHHKSRARREVEFTPALRQRVEQTAEAVRAMLVEEALPAPHFGKHCANCSLKTTCLPEPLVEVEWHAAWSRLFHPPAGRDHTESP